MKAQVISRLFLIHFIIAITFGIAAIPRTITYQGLLTDPSGNPLPDGKHNVGFSLYDVATAGIPLWGEELHEVTTSKGLFAVLLGSKTPLSIPFDKQYWIEIKVNSKAVSPRMQLSASAYAMRADSADVAKSVAVSGVVGLSGMLVGKADAGHRHSVLFKDEKSDTALVIDSVGNVSIGVNNPKDKLEVAGNIATIGVDYAVQTNKINAYGAGGDLTMQHGGNGYGNILFKTNQNTERMRIDVNGNVGIGTIAPQSRLHLTIPGTSGSITEILQLQAQFVNTSNTGTSIGFYTTTNKNAAIISKTVNGWPDGTLEFQTTNYSGIAKDGLQTRMFISHEGNVGIGTPSPATKLEVKGNLQVFDDSIAVYAGYYNGVAKLQITGVDNASVLQFTQAEVADKWAILVKPGDNDLHFLSQNNVKASTLTTGEKATLKANGDLCLQGSVTCSSDRRFKLNLTPISSALEKLTQLQGLYYDWDRTHFPDRNFPETRQIGLIAQDVENVLPELVNTDSQGYKSLSYDKLSAVLVEAVKEQQKTISQLQEENTELKERLTKLENLLLNDANAR